VSLESKVGIAKTGTKSLRATVPEGIVAFLNIQEGYKLEWKMEIQNNKRIVIVKKKNQLDETKRLVSGFVNPDKVKRNG
jgi:hypothetical protein